MYTTNNTHPAGSFDDPTNHGVNRSARRRLGRTVGLGVSVLILASCGKNLAPSSVDMSTFCNDYNNAVNAVEARFNGIERPSRSELVGLAATVRRIAGEAPAAIKGDLTLEAKAIELASKTGDLENAAASAADDRVVAYVNSNCAVGTDATDVSATING